MMCFFLQVTEFSLSEIIIDFPLANWLQGFFPFLLFLILWEGDVISDYIWMLHVVC